MNSRSTSPGTRGLGCCCTAAGALIAGITADLLGLRAAIWIVAAITAASGRIVAVRMYETRHPGLQPEPAPLEG